MINHEAIYKLNPSVVTIRGDVAYDKDENVVNIDMDAVATKTAELETAKEAEKQAAEVAKQTSLDKLAALGLTPEDLKNILG
jgi:hypothetical protein